MALKRRYAAVIALGCVIRGETAHFDHICQSASTGLTAVAIQTGVPCAFGVLTCETMEQAVARSGGDKGNAGADAADAAVAMANLVAEGPQPAGRRATSETLTTPYLSHACRARSRSRYSSSISLRASSCGSAASRSISSRSSCVSFRMTAHPMSPPAVRRAPAARGARETR